MQTIKQVRPRLVRATKMYAAAHRNVVYLVWPVFPKKKNLPLLREAISIKTYFYYIYFMTAERDICVKRLLKISFYLK